MSGMRVVDVNANVVASTQQDERKASVHHHPDVQAALAGEFVKILRERDITPEPASLHGLARNTRIRVVVAVPLTIDERVVGAVVAWRTPISLPKGLYENRVVFGTLLGLFLFGVFSITALTSLYIGRPIKRLIDHTERVTLGAKSATEPIQKPGTFEIQQLSETVAQMAATLESRADYIKAFARNVSHEFKTPLTSIRGTVELLQDHLDTMSPEQRDEFLAMLDADALRLQRLVARLLELARADVARPGQDSTDVVALLGQMQTERTSGDFTVALSAPVERVWVKMGDEALRSVISNLIVNAQQHGATRTDITIEPEDESVAIVVADDGPGISAANAEKVFDEFFTTARDKGGTGLGLSIVRALLNAHGGEVELLESERGATFCVRLPLGHWANI
ncbi:MAG: HAMP domain-containing histidine kinase, partial [Bradymonadaceae bacterium]|nr:HAMP domain-containing histidine kinase [Lujinxingiaceae bacterium]